MHLNLFGFPVALSVQRHDRPARKSGAEPGWRTACAQASSSQEYWGVSCCTLAALAVMTPINVAKADVLISSAPTSNMSCSAGVCVPTASDAVLNATDLENLLAAGNIKVTTTG